MGLAHAPPQPKTASPHQGAVDALVDPTQNMDGDSDAENSDHKAEPPATKSPTGMRAEWLNDQEEKVLPVVIALFMKEIEADCVDYFFDFTESLPRII